MDWAKLVERLQKGEVVSFRPRGNSMQGKIESGNLVTVDPQDFDPKKGDIVFCKVKGCYYVHLVSAVKTDQYQISNNKGHVNGWIGKKAIFGRVTSVAT